MPCGQNEIDLWWDVEPIDEQNIYLQGWTDVSMYIIGTSTLLTYGRVLKCAIHLFVVRISEKHLSYTRRVFYGRRTNAFLDGILTIYTLYFPQIIFYAEKRLQMSQMLQ